VTPKVPFGIGSVSLKLTAGTDPKNPVVATNLYLDVAQLDTDAYFEGMDIGVAVKDLGGPGIQPGTEKQVNPNGFGQRAKSATLTDVEQTAWATTAGTFKLSNLSLKLHKGVEECF
ncbi:cholesterol esterase, partial [Streptomyces sp. MBT57]|nr:cholesterol esterase [Streptomyces sp. MBT57]